MRISDWSSDVCSSDLVAGAGEDDDVGRVFLDRDLHRQREIIGRENLVVEGVIPDFGRIAREAAPDMAAPVDHRDRGPAEQRRWQLGLRLVRTADRKSTRLNSSHYCASPMPYSS